MNLFFLSRVDFKNMFTFTLKNVSHFPKCETFKKKTMIYLDNAATTQMDGEVIREMAEVMEKYFGNPSSIHQLGRESRVFMEGARKKIANLLNVLPAEIIFTSGGTEAINIAMGLCINHLGIKNIITSRIEHPAVVNTIKFYEEKGLVKVKHVRFQERGIIDLESLERILKEKEKSLVCLMHANNEIGNLLPMKETGEICRNRNALFLSDMVQSMGKFENDLGKLELDFTACSAHKFHGPKGVGFLYLNKNIDVSSVVHGGGQERNIRSGTENIAGIAGMVKAMEIAQRDIENNIKHITELKEYLIGKMKSEIRDVEFNGDCEKGGLYNIVNASFADSVKTHMIVQKLDMQGIYVSGGSACHSAQEKISYVLRAIGTDINRTSIRFSLSKFNSKKDIDICINALSQILN